MKTRTVKIMVAGSIFMNVVLLSAVGYFAQLEGSLRTDAPLVAYITNTVATASAPLMKAQKVAAVTPVATTAKP